MLFNDCTLEGTNSKSFESIYACDFFKAMMRKRMIFIRIRNNYFHSYGCNENFIIIRHTAIFNFVIIWQGFISIFLSVD